MKTCYLGGPIAKLSYTSASTWRDDAIAFLRVYGVQGLNPLRGEEFLTGEASLDDRQYDEPLATPRGIVTRDRFDCQRADVVLFNFLGATRSGQGSYVEMGWADAFRRPIVVAIEPDGNPFDGMFLRELAGFVVHDLGEALDLVVTLIGETT